MDGVDIIYLKLKVFYKVPHQRFPSIADIQVNTLRTAKERTKDKGIGISHTQIKRERTCRLQCTTSDSRATQKEIVHDSNQ